MAIDLLHYRPPRIAMLLTGLAAGLHWALLVLLPEARGIPQSLPLAGAIVAALGFAIMIVAWWQFRVTGVAICPTSPTAALITDGVYRLSRNPMYVGMVAMMLGLALFFGAVPFYLAAIAQFAVLNFVFCPYEERKLAANFGEDFETYRESVRRWL